MILYNNTIWNNKLIIRQNKTTENQLNGQDFNCDTINKIFVNIVFTFLLKPNYYGYVMLCSVTVLVRHYFLALFFGS